jgi:hypothetical protein
VIVPNCIASIGGSIALEPAGFFQRTIRALWRSERGSQELDQLSDAFVSSIRGQPVTHDGVVLLARCGGRQLAAREDGESPP